MTALKFAFNFFYLCIPDISYQPLENTHISKSGTIHGGLLLHGFKRLDGARGKNLGHL